MDRNNYNIEKLEMDSGRVWFVMIIRDEKIIELEDFG